MTIHDILQQVTEPGALLTSQQIIAKVWAADPTYKSADPSQHIQGKPGKCKKCRPHPVFEQLGHGIYRVLPTAPPSPIPSIHEKLTPSLADCVGQFLSVRNIRQRVTARFPDTHWLSINPLDHSKGGACRYCNQAPLFKPIRRNLYQVLPLPAQAALNPESRPNLAAALSELLRIHSPHPEEPTAFLTALGSLSGISPLDFNLLATAWREEVVLRLLEFGPLSAQATFRQCLSQPLQERYGIQPELADWAVATWAEALKDWQECSYAAVDQPAPWVADFQVPLVSLQPEPVAPQVYRLKKQRRRVALLAYLDSHHLLGVRREIASAVLGADLAKYRRKRERLPVSLPLPHQELLTYIWYAFPSARLCQEALAALDQSFR